MKRLASAAALAVVMVSGCSQVDAYAPVSGGPKSTVEIAVADVLAAQQVPVLVRPECELVEQAFACKGSTTAGQPIVATSTATAPFMLTLTVGDTVIFDGDAQDAINDAMRAGS